MLLCAPLKRVAKRLPVCPTYELLKLGQVSLYTPDSENLSRGGGGGGCVLFPLNY